MAIYLPVNLPTVAAPTTSGGQTDSIPLFLDVNLPAVVTATKVIVTANPAGAVTNTAFSLTVNATDASNTVATGYSSSATVTKASGPGTLSGTLTASFSGGVLTFTNLLLDTIGTYTLTISSGALTPAATASFTVAAPVATHLAFSQQPIATGKTIAFTIMPKVQALLAGGGVDTAYVANVTLAITSGSGGTAGAGATLSGTLTVAAVAGVADFTSAGLSLNQGGTAYQLRATSGSLTAANSSAFDVAGIYDLPNRADSATTLSTADTGQTYTALFAGVMGISSHKFYSPNGTITDHGSAVTGVSANGKVSIVISTIGAAFAGFLFRESDTNNLWMLAVSSSTTISLYKRQTGTWTQVATNTSATINAGDTISATISGSSIICAINGSTLSGFTVTDAFNSSATGYGVYVSDTGTGRLSVLKFVPA